jgi:hypothetical protein
MGLYFLDKKSPMNGKHELPGLWFNETAAIEGLLESNPSSSVESP